MTEPPRPEPATDAVPAQQQRQPSSGLGLLADLQMLASMIRADGDDLASMVRVLRGSLAAVLPAGMLDVTYLRSLSDRLTARPGRPTRILVHGVSGDLELAEGDHGRIEGRVLRIVNGVVIFRRTVAVGEWIDLLAAELHHRAATDASAKDALTRLLGP